MNDDFIKGMEFAKELALTKNEERFGYFDDGYRVQEEVALLIQEEIDKFLKK